MSHVSVQKLIKKFGQDLEDLKSENEISIVEMDEMHTYIGNKKNIAGSGLLLIELGKSSSTALLVAEEWKLENYSGKIEEKRDWRSDDRSLESICRVSSRKESYSNQKQKHLQLRDITAY